MDSRRLASTGLFLAAMLFAAGIPARAQDSCTFTFSPASGNAPASGGNYTVTVTASASTCVRPLPVSNVDWITISFGGGTGSGTFGYTVKQNFSINPRTGTISHGSQTYTVTQAGASCTLSLSASSATFNSAGGNGNISVIASAAECQWTASTPASWITITSGASGTGNGAVSYQVAPNTGAQRNDVITVGNVTFNVIQRAPCTYTLDPNMIQAPASETLGSVAVIPSDQSCPWNVTNAPSWISITFGANGGTGNGTVGYRIAANNSTNPRTGTFLIAGQPVTVTQEGGVCGYSLSTTDIQAPSIASTGSISVTAASGCSWQARSDVSWVTITGSAAGSGNGSVNYSIAANTTGQPRSGTLTIAGIPVNITQETGSCTYSLSETSISAPYFAIARSITVTAPSGCTWQANTSATWVTISSGASGNGNGTVNISIAANNNGPSRTATVTIAGQPVTVTQDGLGCQVTATPAYFSLPALGGTASFSISAAGCPWSVTTSTGGWLRFYPPTSGTGNASVSFSVDPNNSSSARTALIDVAGFPVTVTQAGVSCEIKLASYSVEFSAAGGSGSVLVSAPPACSWNATPNVSWIRTTGESSGQGDGEISFTVDANISGQSRNGLIIVGGAVYAIAQKAANCTLAMTPTSATFPSAGGSGTIAISTNCTWQAATSAPWITLGASSGTAGDTVLTFTVSANTASQSRSGVIMIAGANFSVSQAGKSTAGECTYSVSPASGSVGGLGGSGSFRVVSSKGCEWTPVASAEWLKVGWNAVDGTGTVTYTADFNPVNRERTATILIGGQTFTLTQSAGGPYATREGVVNGASFLAGPVAPGEIISIFGQGLGPKQAVTFQLTPDGRKISSSLAGTRVLFDDVPAPIIATSDGQVSAIVPYEVAGKAQTNLRVEYNGELSQVIPLSVTATAPAVFTQDMSGKGLAAIINWDSDPAKWTVNSPASRAARGGYVMIFATGEGQTNPPGETGLLVKGTLDQLPRPRNPVAVQIGGRAATVTYAGAAPGMVSGLLQINVQIPANAPTGDAVPVVVRVGNNNSQDGVVMAIR